MEEIENFFNEIDNFFNEIDNLTRFDFDEPQPAAAAPRRRKVYLRGITDPFDFYTDKEFKARYRFEKVTVRNVLLPLVFEENNNDNRGLPVSPEMQMLTALRFYSTGCFQIVAGNQQYLSQPTVSHIVAKISRILATKWPQFVYFPRTEEDLRRTEQGFERLGRTAAYSGLPNIIGAIDCTHVPITRPRGVPHSEAFRNRYNKFSLNVQAVVGPDMKFYDIVARWPGSAHDSRIFRNSRLHARLNNNELQGSLVGDSGYACTRTMLTPVLNPQTRPQQRYNTAHIKTRNVVQRTFGVIKSRFPCLKNGLRNKLTTTSNIIVACVVLHNIGKMYNDEYDEEVQIEPREDPIPNQAIENTPEGLAFQSILIKSQYT